MIMLSDKHRKKALKTKQEEKVVSLMPEKIVEEYFGVLLPDEREKIIGKLADMPAKCRIGHAKAMVKSGMNAAIKAKCLECVGYGENLVGQTSEQKEIRECTGWNCCLFAFRPYK